LSSIPPLEGKVALVTGGGRGIGRAHAIALAGAGARVVVNDLGATDRGEGANQDVAEQVAAEIRASGGEAIANSHSVASWSSARDVVQSAIETFGDLDILVNNAGISRLGDIDVVTEQDWNSTLAVNLTGSAATMHWAYRHWQDSGARRRRAIINTSSPAGTNPLPHSIAYVASKAAVSAITAGASEAFSRYGVRVNAIAPIARTRLTDAVPFIRELMNRKEGSFDPDAPENISPLVVYLASPECRFTGRTFGIEGGDVYLFDGYNARQRFSNGPNRWTVTALSTALENVDPQDRGFAIAPGAHYPGPHPSNETLIALAEHPDKDR
jgi:NAD(P)-dependent dehydrogenase (short-subunit alcohol dehydrogenase family)